MRPRPRLTLLAALAVAAPLSLGAAAPADAALQAVLVPSVDAANPYLIGRGISDITGPAAENGMMGYSKDDQVTSGISQRMRSRAFVVGDPASGKRVVYVVADMGMDFRSVDEAVQKRLKDRGLSGKYQRDNVLITGTHTHAGPGGYSSSPAYNLATGGFQKQLLDAIADGITDSIVRADANVKPGSINIGRSRLTNASVNRSKTAFDRNPDADKSSFPNGIDPTVTTLRFKQGGQDVGLLNWFATHPTSLTNKNTLISPDNKGYAEYLLERKQHGVDYLKKDPEAFVAAFANTATADMSPNLNLKPGSGPTEDPWQNLQILGGRQASAANDAFSAATTPVTGGIDFRKRYINLAATSVRPEFTHDGKPHTTCSGVVSAAMSAGSTEDGPALPIFPEGQKSIPASLADLLRQPLPDALKTCQEPKLGLVPTGATRLTPDVVPVQVVKIGQLWFPTIPGEISIVAGLKVRQAVAKAVGTSVDNVIVQPYTGDYNGYTVTPAEYDDQQYEGGSTLNGRYETPAYMQELSAIGTAIKSGAPTPDKATPSTSLLQPISWRPGVVFDAPYSGKKFGDVVTAPRTAYDRGDSAVAEFSTGHPKNDLRLGSTYLEVQRQVNGQWVRVADDGDFETTYQWTRIGVAVSKATLTWRIPADAAPGTYRLVHHGNAKPAFSSVKAFTGATQPFSVR